MVDFDLETKKNLVIINLFYIGLIALYCILHAGPLNLLVFFGMLVIANVAEILIG
ncbi:hypothetical protein [Limosilactobacillus reuteri]|uniref:Uncharacterized protein n=2 Tax=Limosilactobacillus reuteri TaxID=1598 RepID=B3XN53_LIMR1|nr:hypothetical protein [Limosilactobacillus reuteri]EDX43377.1 hypothetical protein Lreu23DRAFT_4896 [Limosilactobacillus reuteri subsp. rodentium]MCC4372408.1 hypothetical protein [Limosilactobacillus reuteri]MCC4475846.1 hypothetical protein [Limosilactobacillus reuteri]